MKFPKVRPLTVLTWAIYVTCVLAAIALVLLQFNRSLRMAEQYDELFAAYQELATDCASAPDCITSAPDPADVDALRGERGADGLAGPRGAVGRDGTSGRDGVDGIDGIDGAAGSEGGAGQPGADGAPGSPGADGAPGADGQPGPAGEPGADGQPPATWSFSVLGLSYTCDRSDPFDPVTPAYSCTINP